VPKHRLILRQSRKRANGASVIQDN
jgi:hypothetical protein